MLYIEEYSKYLKTNKRSANSTVQSYLRDIRKFADYIERINVDCLRVSKQVILAYLIHMQKNGQATSSILRMAASLRSYYGYLHSKSMIEEDPALDIEAPKLPKRDFQVLTAKETEALLTQPECVNFKGYRDKAMLELLYATGIKVSEIVDLKVSDVHLPEGYITCGCEQKARMVPVGMIAAKALKEYLGNARLQTISDHEEDTYLFVNLSGGRLSRQGFWKIVKYYKDKAKISKEITPNTLRHSFAVHLMENGADVVSVKEMLGHSAISSTRVYSNMVNKRINDVYKKAHPRA